MQYYYNLDCIENCCGRSYPILAGRQSHAAVRDLQTRDLVRFFPGATCNSLARLSCQSRVSVRERLRLLAQAGLIAIHVDGKSIRAYPVPVEVP
jgi:hypothetical protein